MKNTNFDFKVIPMYQYSIFSKSDVYFIRFIHYKQVFFYSKNYCSCPASRGAPQFQRLHTAVIVYRREFEKKITKQFLCVFEYIYNNTFSHIL